MKKTKQLPLIRKDKRGSLIEIFKGKFAQCNFLLMKKGSVWGNHYHKRTREYFYVLEGELAVSFFALKDKRETKKIFKTGDVFTIKPHTLHTICVLKASQCLVLYSQQFSQEQPDISYLNFGG